MALPNSLRADAERIWQAAIGAVDPQSLLAGAPAELLGPLPAGRIVVVGAGKAAAGMAAGVEGLLAAAGFPAARLSGLVSVPEGCGRKLASIEVRHTRPAGVNLPTDRVVTATAAMMESLGRLGPDDLAIALVTGGAEPLHGHAPGVRRRAAAALARRRITVFRDTCAALLPGAVVLGRGARLACDVPLLATGAEAPGWLAGSGLALDDQGFVLTGSTLQSSSHPEIFAVGDLAARADAPHPRSGVHAVRAGPALALNLRRFVGGDELQPYQPPARTLNLIACGDRRAIVSWGDWSTQGRWAWWWKDRIDRTFVARHGGGGEAPAAANRST